MKELIQTLQSEIEDRLLELDGCIQREISFNEVEKKISVAIGMRRTGKTHLMLMKIKKYLSQGVAKSKILYIDFEDDRLLPLTQEKLAALIDGFYSCYPENHNHTCYLFMDEIQNVEDWALVIRRMFTSKKVKIYLTGSSAKLLSKEIATSLRGRSISTEIWPLSFSEYLHATSRKLPSLTKSKKSKDFLFSYLNEYIHVGGFPETVNHSDASRTIILREYIQTVLFRDIVERHKITNIVAVKYMIKYLLSNAATNLSTNKLYNDLKSQGFALGRSTVYEYIAYIEDAYLVFSVPLFSESIRKTQSNPQKIYAIDTALVNASRLKTIDNKGRYLENLVYLECRRRGDEIYYYLTDDRYEVDFFTKSLDGTLHLYQVTWDTASPDTYEREKRALVQAEKELGIKGVLITADTFPEWVFNQ